MLLMLFTMLELQKSSQIKTTGGNKGMKLKVGWIQYANVYPIFYVLEGKNY